MSDLAALPPLDSASELNQLERVVDTFIAPGKTFADIRRNASWWLPWVIISIVTIAFAFSVQQKVGWSQVYQNALRQNPKAMQQLQHAGPQQAATAMAIGSKATAISLYAQPILMLLGGLILAGVFWVTINYGFGGRARFGQVYAVWFYASLPLTITAILAIITLYAGLDPSAFSIKNPVGTNIGYYLPSGAAPWLVALLTPVGILKIWTAVLLTIGLAAVAQVKKSSAAIAVFGWWILVILVSTAWAAAMR